MYSKYWVEDCDSKKVVCFRAPMSVHNNIRAMNVVRNENIDFWYQYMPTTNIINCHDMFYPALNGADNDGDAILVTDNEILLRNTRDVPAIVCVQKKAEKCVITDELLALSNKNSFGNDIGKITNRVTAMFDVMTEFEPGSRQYETLGYRIKCGQLLQQACIDKTKGIISNPMPKEWYDYHSLTVKEDDTNEDQTRKEFNKQILAEKKPYFMIYVYPGLKNKYRDFTKNASRNYEGKSEGKLGDLLTRSDRNEDEEKYVKWYYKKLPVSDGSSVMNRLCHYVEREFDGYSRSVKDKKYPYRELLISKNFNENIKRHDILTRLTELYKDYRQETKEFALMVKAERQQDSDIISLKKARSEQFRRDCQQICPNCEQLCDMLLQICYKAEYSKRFVWDMCGEQLARNLLEKNRKYSFFVRDDGGDVLYGGNLYKIITRDVENEEDFV